MNCVLFLCHVAKDWTVYVGDHVAYDGREGAIGATEVKVLGDKSICFLRSLCVAVRPRFTTETESEYEEMLICDATKAAREIQKVSLIIFGWIVLWSVCAKK